ncbi:arginase family protein, partial [Mesorhizobium japonicum]|uniref:arginase family protein n=1 Tax=Mesorhizobium japonicum TaxID=2066070 RepID=UPI003B58E494
ALVAAGEASGATSVYLHVDLDVLDPAELRGLLDPAPFGVAASALTAAIRALVARFELAGATVASYAPTGPEDLADDGPTILRIIGALGSSTPR